MEHTYNVVGNVNENGVILIETTFGGLADLDGHGDDSKSIDILHDFALADLFKAPCSRPHFGH